MSEHLIVLIEPLKGMSWLEMSERILELEPLQQAIGGGYIECVPVPDHPDLVMVVDEEGVRKGMPHNPQASYLAGQPIVGLAVICGQEEPEMVALTNDEWRRHQLFWTHSSEGS